MCVRAHYFKILKYNENMRMARDFRVLCLTFVDDIVSLFSNI